MSNAPIFQIDDFYGMPQPSNDDLLFNEALCARTRTLRDEKGWTAVQMAIALGVPAERYRKYKMRSPIPHYLIPRLAAICDCTIEYVLTGRTSKQLDVAPKAPRMRA